MNTIFWCILALNLCSSRIQVYAYFGLTSRVPIPETVVPLSLSSVNASSLSLCEVLHLRHRRLRRLCRRDKDLAETLVEALRLGVIWCRKQFEHDRWNCSVESSRVHLLKGAFKETAFLYALVSSSLAHTVARGCGSGRLAYCTCDDSSPAAEETRKAWRWGGCGDNVKYGVRFVRRFLLGCRRLIGSRAMAKGRDLTARLERHNSEVGLQVLRQGVAKVCKCHGISGSCSVRTCWKQLSNFVVTATTLKDKYERAVRIKTANHAGRFRGNEVFENASTNRQGSSTTTRLLNVKRKYGKRHRKSKQGHLINKTRARNAIVRNDQKDLTDGTRVQLGNTKIRKSKRGQTSLLYLETSPDFCEANNYGPGTSGRDCVKGENCEIMCCGRGYNVQVKTVKNSCHCRVLWCCSVRCDVCVTRKDFYTCK